MRGWLDAVAPLSPAAADTSMKLGINGFGRIGRLVLRALWGRPGLSVVHLNDPKATTVSAAHLLSFDSVHGRWSQPVHPAAPGDPAGLLIGAGGSGGTVGFSAESDPTAVPWREAGVDVVLECSGQFKTPAALEPYFSQLGLQRVIVACPVRGLIAGEEALNVVFGINHGLYDPGRHRLLTAASCTTNCLAPLLKVVHESFGIRHGSITTLHDVTATQLMVDGFASDLRRARSGLQSLIPTTTGSARAIGLIFPDLAGKLDGHAVRVPLLNASLTDVVLELEQQVSAGQVNAAFEAAANGPLQGILGYETQPLVSCDYVNDSRSAIVDGLSTLVTGGSQLKVYAWYDNEWAYSCRLADLACHVAAVEGR